MEKFLNAHTISYILENEKVEKNNFIQNFSGCDFVYDFIKEYGGRVFDKGLFKIHTFEYVEKWTDLIINNYFREEIKGEKLICFASNWQGCMYCIDSRNQSIAYFDPATSEFFKINDVSLNSFFDKSLMEDEYDIIFEDYFKETVDFLKITELKYEDSIGHKIYLYLGGEDDVSNYEVVNTEVLWELQIQVAERINKIPDE